LWIVDACGSVARKLLDSVEREQLLLWLDRLRDKPSCDNPVDVVGGLSVGRVETICRVVDQ